jgi:hypothetical protein
MYMLNVPTATQLAFRNLNAMYQPRAMEKKLTAATLPSRPGRKPLSESALRRQPRQDADSAFSTISL